MFKRRTKATFFEKVKVFLRTFYSIRMYMRYILFKLSRSGDSDHRIVCGLASGIAISVTPFVGLHFTLSMIIAFILRGSPVAAAIGTAFGNPITFPFIWITIYKTGLFFMPSFKMVGNVKFVEFFISVKDTIVSFDIDKFFDKIYPVFFPMLIGSIPYYLITFLLSYFVIRSLLKEYRLARQLIFAKKCKCDCTVNK